MSLRRTLFATAVLLVALTTLVPAWGSAGDRAQLSHADSIARRRSEPEPAAAAPWLARFNLYRKLAGVAPVTANNRWSLGGRLHSRYMVKNDVVEHIEDPDNPWYTPQGAAAGANGNVMARYTTSATDIEAVDAWITGPFHALGMLDPRLKATGFGSYRLADGGLQMAATLDTRRGVGPLPPGTRFPIYWPNRRAAVPVLSFVSEYPDPLTSCPGYGAPSGLPVYLLLGAGDKTPRVTAHSFRQGAVSMPHCVFHEGNYRNPDKEAQALGRAILNARDAIVLIPKAPLEPGATYTVSITANGTTTRWSFTISRHARGVLATGP